MSGFSGSSTTTIEGYGGPIPVNIVSPHKVGTNIDGYSVTDVPVRIVSPHRVGTNIDGYSVAILPVKVVSPNRVGTSIDGYSVATVPVKLVSPNKVSVSLDGYSTQPLPTTGQGPDSWPAFDGYASIMSVSGTIATSSALDVGNYFLVATTDVWFDQGASPNAIWQARGKLLTAGTYLPLRIAGAANKIAAITGGATGKLNIIPVH